MSQSRRRISLFFVKNSLRSPRVVPRTRQFQQKILNSVIPKSICAEQGMLTRLKMKSATPSEQHARMLLSAWNTGDLGLLRETLSLDWTSIDLASQARRGEAERERMEMLTTIAEAMRNWLRRGGDAPAEDLQVSMQLLRHLAGCERLWRERGV
jgi:hypothetical protein